MVTECFPGAERLEHGDGHPPPPSAVVRLGSSYISAMSWGELNLLDKSIFVKICLFLSENLKTGLFFFSVKYAWKVDCV
jgi:hypothetical protein